MSEYACYDGNGRMLYCSENYIQDEIRYMRKYPDPIENSAGIVHVPETRDVCIDGYNKKDED